MNLIKLEASKKDARRLARCLIGSEFNINGEVFTLIAVLDDRFIGAVIQNDNESYCIDAFSIMIDINFLTFCPYTAMREKIKVEANHREGLIDEITRYDEVISASIDGSYSHYDLNDILLYLIPIENNEYDGCYIQKI